jgi:tRNA-splicing ligase RtcB
MYEPNDRVKTWLPPEQIEPAARAQIDNVSRMPFLFKHVAVMPDCHLGKGATVGTVIATKGAIIPAAVGVDVGCGMVAVRTKFLADQLPDEFRSLREGIECRRSAQLIDELPMAYKDIDEVMQNSNELVRVEHVLRQVVNVKGD